MSDIKVDNPPSVLSVPSDPEKDITTPIDEEITGNEYVDPKIERSLVRKFDLFILPMCGMYEYQKKICNAMQNEG